MQAAYKLSTDNVAYDQFRPHGRVEITCGGSGIIRYQARGPFNREIIGALREVEPRLLKNMADSRRAWAALVAFEGSCMALPECIAALGDYLKEQMSQDIAHRAVAFVLPVGLEGRVFMAPHFKLCYAQAGISFRIFDSDMGAEKWLLQQLSLARSVVE